MAKNKIITSRIFIISEFSFRAQAGGFEKKGGAE